MQCAEFEKTLELQDEGPLSGAALAHLETCTGCRDLLADIGAIRALAVELDSEGIAPPERVWISLRNQLEAEGIIQDALPARRTVVSGGWWSVFQRPAFAGFFLSLLLIAASLVSFRWSSPASNAGSQLALEQASSPVPSADSVFKEEVRTVDGDSMAGLRRPDSAVNESIRRNLQVVDNFIAMCEKSVREQPDNQLAREYLYGAYQQKAELLATAMNRGMAGGLQ